MFVRDKRIGRYTYVYLVENVRADGRTKQRIIANLGRKEVVVAHGDLDRLGHRARDPALFNLAIDSKLRGCDLVRLQVEDVCAGGRVRDRATVIQKKTGWPQPAT